jgi:hypothetical protein
MRLGIEIVLPRLVDDPQLPMLGSIGVAKNLIDLPRLERGADSMSRKSGFSITGALKPPSIESELPHHPDALAGGHLLEVVAFGALVNAENADRRWIGHAEI